MNFVFIFLVGFTYYRTSSDWQKKKWQDRQLARLTARDVIKEREREELAVAADTLADKSMKKLDSKHSKLK